ncbi:hypothetical protein MRB53_028411 [Persea americana]|uniref:Uncharacterized protein n=1 Tax=Persea americana TaxID=3435 RepID=A0ACC2KFU8_PERAE|nr:hypothetical protein MRB53_028411 [Persea americana]
MDTVVSLKDKILDKIGAPHEEQLALFYRGHTVVDLKERLVDKNYLPQGDYFFFHGERIMEDSESLLSQGIKDGDSIIVLTRRARRQD